MTNPEIIAYLLDADRRKLLNWRGIEKSCGITYGRIKNVCLYKKGSFRPDEIDKLNVAIQKLQIESSLDSNT